MTQTCDFLIVGGTVVDGSGAPPAMADVAIEGDRIVAVGDLAGWRGATVLRADGLVVAPGFIDTHSHDDFAVLATPALAPKISQGVTTVIAGNCGVSAAPLEAPRHFPAPLHLLGPAERYRFARVADYRRAFEAAPAAVNLALFAGHANLRVAAMDASDRPATEAEIRVMGAILDQALADGALGLSTGLAYPAAAAATTDEVIALAGHVARGGGVYVTHLRNERDGVVEAVEEALAIGRVAGVDVIISHHKCIGRRNFGRSTETLARIRAATAAGQAVALDLYPYTASSTVLLPDFIRDADRVLVTSSQPHPEMAGRDLADIAAAWGCPPAEAARRLHPAGAVYFQMDEGDLVRILAEPNAMIGSDGVPSDHHPHPRLWGTFPRVLGRYAREQGVLTLHEAVHRMTGLPARVFGLRGRGRLAPGAFADVVLFDARTVIDRATYDHPCQPADGIAAVLVNGRPVWREGAWTGAAPGRFLARS